jgi:hypothetical protein
MIKTEIEGSFIAQVFRFGVERLKTKRTKNIILSNKMGDQSSFGNRLQVGTGTSAPLFSNTNLDSFLTQASGPGWVEQSSILTGTDYEKESINTFTFSVGQAVGNLTELGVSVNSSPTIAIHTRALFKDALGDPTVITLTAQDQLVVTYFVKKTISMATTTGVAVADVNGVPTNIDYTIRPCISTTADGGTDADEPSSIYGFNHTMFIANSNIISIDPVTFIPTSLVAPTGSAAGVSAIQLTGTGNEVTHTFTFQTGTANTEWRSATLSTSNNPAISVIYFQIEFNGPSYITKVNTETITFPVIEVVNQVI